MRYERQSRAGVVCSRRSAEKPDRKFSVRLLKAARQTIPKTEPNNSPSYSMNVRLYGRGEVKVDDIRDVLEIDTSGDSKLFVLAP